MPTADERQGDFSRLLRLNPTRYQIYDPFTTRLDAATGLFVRQPIAGALALDYQFAAEVLNFGAFLSFMGVNLAAFWELYVRRERQDRSHFKDAVLPGLGFLFCFEIWWSLPGPAKIVGGLWCVIGIAYCAIMTRGFRSRPIAFDFTDV